MRGVTRVSRGLGTGVLGIRRHRSRCRGEFFIGMRSRPGLINTASQSKKMVLVQFRVQTLVCFRIGSLKAEL
jgi:hypothetical protein